MNHLDFFFGFIPYSRLVAAAFFCFAVSDLFIVSCKPCLFCDQGRLEALLDSVEDEPGRLFMSVSHRRRGAKFYDQSRGSREHQWLMCGWLRDKQFICLISSFVNRVWGFNKLVKLVLRWKNIRDVQGSLWTFLDGFCFNQGPDTWSWNWSKSDQSYKQGTGQLAESERCVSACLQVRSGIAVHVKYILK